MAGHPHPDPALVERFPVGRRVRMTLLGQTKFCSPRAPSATGRIVGYGRTPGQIRVLKDGTKTPATYHASHWQLVEEESR